MKLLARIAHSTRRYFPRRHALLLQAVVRDIPCYFALDLDHSAIVRFCGIADREILSFAIDTALSPWMNRPATAEGPVIQDAPDPASIRRALSGFSHHGPTFSLRIGALQVDEIPGPREVDRFSQNPDTFSCTIPNGDRRVGSTALFSTALRDHWLAHRGTEPQPLARTISASNGLPAVNLAALAILASVRDALSFGPGGDHPPELFAKAVVPIQRNLRRNWPDSPHEAWNAVRLAEQLLCCSGAVREDPTGIKPAWRRGPRFSEALDATPSDLVDLAGALVAPFLAADELTLDSFVALAAAEFGGQYPALVHGSDMDQPTGHDLLDAAPLMTVAHEVSEKLREKSATSFLLQPHSW